MSVTLDNGSFGGTVRMPADASPAKSAAPANTAPSDKPPAATPPGIPKVTAQNVKLALAAQKPQAPPTPLVQARAAPAVDNAVASVRDTLQQVESGTVGKVTDITPTVTALPPADRNTLVSRLSDQELRTWMDATRQHTNPEDQQPLFNTLAQGLDNQQLGRVITSLDRDNVINDDNAAFVGRFGDAIAANKPAGELREFVQSAAGQIESDQKTALIVAKSLETLGAQAMPSTYSGGIPYLPPNHFEPALAALSDSQLDSVVQAAAQERFEGNARVYDPAPLVALLDRAATAPLSSQQTQRLVESGLGVMQRLVQSPDEGPRTEEINAQLVGSLARLIGSEHGASVEQRAQLFEMTANTWGGFAGNNTQVDTAIASALEGLLTTDTTGVMGELETQHREGAGMTRFVREMMAQGRAEELKPIVAQLQLGNDLQGDPITRFAARDSAGNHRHANVLGYFVGSVYSGVSQLNASKDDTVGMLGDVFDLTSILTGAGGRAFSALQFLTTKVVEQRVDDYKSGTIDLRDTISQLAYPASPDGRRYEGSAAEGAYDSALGRVIDNNG